MNETAVPEKKTKIESYLTGSIATMLCCCPIFGIVALVYSVITIEAKASGDYEKAAYYSKRALIWMAVSFFSPLVLVFLKIMILLNH